MATQETSGKARKQLVTVSAKPQAVTFITTECAVLVIDMQNDFGSKGGMFERAGIDISMIQAAVEPTRRVLVAGRRSGIPVVYLKMGFKADLSDAGAADSPNLVRHQFMGLGRESGILIRDTWNTDIIDELTPEPADFVLYKHRFSGFFETDLDRILKELGARHLIVTGCTTSICVESTIRDAMFRDYSCVLLADCTGEPIGYGLPRSNHDASLLTIEVLLGWTASSQEFVGALAATEHKLANEASAS